MDTKLSPLIEVISDQFPAPQLGRKRRVAALLPHDYYKSGKSYPVLYLQDGQNLFNNRSPFGNWHVDRQLALLASKGMGELIVIAIDHGEQDRIQEYSPSEVVRSRTGFGRQYARFITETLKPFVDNHFRTLPERQHTGIGGSSMGGLISIYASIIYPDVWGRVMVFSPSLWIAPRIYFQAINFNNLDLTKVYLYGGGKEGSNMVPNMERLKEALDKKGPGAAKVQFQLSIDPDGQHNETRWGKEFPHAVEWLFFK